MKTKLTSLLRLSALLFLAGSVRAADPSTAPAAGVREVLTQGGARVGQEIVLEGFVTGVCHSGGRKAFLHDLNPDYAITLRVERTGEMKAFDQDLKGRTLRVTGIVRELRIDQAYLDAWETRAVAAHAAKEKTKTENCSGECNDSLPLATARKRITALRAQLAKADRGYLSSIWVDGLSWEVKPDAR
ncbi:hypothetical protein [Opitutus sp. ER46]|uniref:hypothetical protein n=1 Tax=Opitutus sp. ER46 TaxID=2161864 RepID=UPI000D309D9A|nr:hypothetical protein [Opitutus sp. ER46]PTX96520.1 hypothetical protein DB354_07640 [Opitutus sp. ER46]